jgi:hypothetical protein
MHLGAALIYSFIEVELLTNSECYKMLISSEGMGAKVHVREGKNPDHQLRSPNDS